MLAVCLSCVLGLWLCVEFSLLCLFCVCIIVVLFCLVLMLHVMRACSVFFGV